MTGSPAESPAEEIACVEDALVVPARDGRPATVVDAAGAPVVDAGGFRRDVHVPCAFLDRSHAPKADLLGGTYLYGGEFWPHFGHFLFESLSRLWAAPRLGAELDGILLLRARASRLLRVHRQVLDLLGIHAPIRFVDRPTAVERLYVPRQGCGMGALAAGTPAFRRFVREGFGRVPPRTDAPSVYLTRTGYGLRRGGLLGEEEIERRLAAQGYAIFAPERHGIEAQIATYLGAERIVAPDSSALHLAGFVARAETRIAIILRRHDGARDLLPQIAGFTGRAPLVVNAITALLHRENERNETWATVAELDLPKVARHLRRAGFLEPSTRWPAMSAETRTALRDAAAARLGARFLPVWPESGACASPDADRALSELGASHPPENCL